MSVVEEYRRKMTVQQSRGGEALRLGALAALVFVGVAGGALGWNAWREREAAPRSSAAAAPKTAADPADLILERMNRQSNAVSTPTPAGVRIGARSRATFLGQCMDNIPFASMTDMFNPSGTRSGPQSYEAKFMMLDQFSKVRSMFAIATPLTGQRARGDTANLELTSTGEFVACALAQPSRSLCNGDNRAAALSYLSGYFTAYESAASAAEKLSPLERHRAGTFAREQRHRQIMDDVAKHAKAGVIVSGDIGLFGNSTVKSLIARHAGAVDLCSGKPG